MTALRYWYPSCKADGPGYIHRDWDPNAALCGEALDAPEEIYYGDKPKPGWSICEKCKEKRKQFNPGVDLDWSQIDPQGAEFAKLNRHEQLEVLAARDKKRRQADG